MIGPDQVVNGVWIATVLMLLGLVPGLYQSLAEGVSNFAASLTLRFGLPHPRMPHTISQPAWLAAAGAAVLLFTLLAYLL